MTKTTLNNTATRTGLDRIIDIAMMHPEWKLNTFPPEQKALPTEKELKKAYGKNSTLHSGISGADTWVEGSNYWTKIEIPQVGSRFRNAFVAYIKEISMQEEHNPEIVELLSIFEQSKIFKKWLPNNTLFVYQSASDTCEHKYESKIELLNKDANNIVLESFRQGIIYPNGEQRIEDTIQIALPFGFQHLLYKHKIDTIDRHTYK